MIFDKENLFSDDQAITVTAPSTNSIRLGANAGAGEPLHLLAQVTAPFTATGAATLTVALEDSADNSSFAAIQTTGAIAVADLVAGYKLPLQLPATHREYVRFNFTVATGPMLTGNLKAGLVKDIQTNF